MKSGLDWLRVVPYTRDRIPNLYPGGELPWQVYHTVRNALVRVCRRYGPTGPMGELTIDDNEENLMEYLAATDLQAWESGDDDPMYWIIDDQYNHERYCYAELHGNDPFSAGWLLSVTMTLRDYDGWALGIVNIPDNYVLVFGNKLLVKGRQLSRCRSASEVVEAVGRLFQSGSKRWWKFWK